MPGAVRPLPLRAAAPGDAGRRQRLMQLAFLGLLAMVVIGLNPLSERVKTIPATGDGDVSRQLVYLVLGALALVGSWGVTWRQLAAIPGPILLALAWCGVTLLWSVVPGVGVRRLVLTVLIIWTVFRCVEAIGYDQAIRAMRAVLLVTLVLNYVAIAVTPAAIHHATELAETNLIGSWRGILAHKNWAGPICAFTVIAFLFDAGRWPIAARGAIVAATAFFLYKTQSKTSMGILAVSLAAGFAYLRYNPRFRALLIPSAIVVGSAAVIYLDANWAALTARLGDPQAFTGRSQIWELLLRYAADHPWGGAGYESFWNIGPDGPAFEYGRGWLQTLGNGHSGYLDLLSQVGVPGLVLIVGVTVAWPLVRLLGSTSAPRQPGALVMALLVFCAGHNLTETSLFDRDAITEVFLMTAIALAGLLVDPATAPVAARPARRTRLAMSVPEPMWAERRS
jgi:O-antigen ligase